GITPVAFLRRTRAREGLLPTTPRISGIDSQRQVAPGQAAQWPLLNDTVGRMAQNDADREKERTKRRLLDKLNGAISEITEQDQAAGTSLRHIATGVDVLEGQIQRLQTQLASDQAMVQGASNTAECLRTQIQALVTALEAQHA